MTRLNKYIADSGMTSRRKADELTRNGNVKINNHVVLTPGVDVGKDDIVEVNGKRVSGSAKKVYIVLNKPKDFITTVQDEKNRPTVMLLVKDIEERIFPVGRLDGATTGILILTNDGEFANKLLHPKNEIYKTYRALVEGELSSARIAKLEKGVDIGGYITAPAKVKIIKQNRKNTVVEIAIHEGRNRQVRKMFAAVGNKVTDLERISIGDVHLGNLLIGQWRKLRKEEIDGLIRLSERKIIRDDK